MYNNSTIKHKSFGDQSKCHVVIVHSEVSQARSLRAC